MTSQLGLRGSGQPELSAIRAYSYCTPGYYGLQDAKRCIIK